MPLNGIKRERKRPWWNREHPFLAGANRRWGVILQGDDCKPFGDVPDDLRRLPHNSIFTAPMVLVNQGCSRFAFPEFDVVFQHSIQSIADPKKQNHDLLLFLTALLNSPLATYYTFHTAANLGVERDKVHFEELLQLPFLFLNKRKTQRKAAKLSVKSRSGFGEHATKWQSSETTTSTV